MLTKELRSRISREVLDRKIFTKLLDFLKTSLRRIPSVFYVDFLLHLNDGLLYSLCAPQIEKLLFVKSERTRR